MVIRAVVLALVALAVIPAAASAHARLEGTSPARGATVATEPARVVFRFDEPVEASFGAVRVFDARGARADDGRLVRPGRDQREAGTALRRGLADGTYTATYRVISADGHPVSGGFTFSIGHAGAAPSRDVADLIVTGNAGRVTGAAFAATKALGYLAIALVLGGLGFMALVWRPALAQAAGTREDWARATGAFGTRALTLLSGGLALGVLTSAAGLVLQGATAAGTSAWSAMDPTVVREVASTHAGTAWALRLGDWALLTVALGVVAGLRAVAKLRPAVLAMLGLPALALAVLPALAGHASTQHPVWALFPLDVAHVLAMSAWLGGLVGLLACVPAATRALEQADRSRLLAAVLTRFSAVALAAVCVLAATGTTQAILEVRHIDALTGSAFGRSVLIKSGLLLALIGFGAVNRRRVVPALRRLAAVAAAPGGRGRVLRLTLRSEVALVLVVLGVTGALTGYAPPTSADAGPQSLSRRMGPIDLELTVDPAAVGVNEMHVYLFRARDGTPFTATKQLTVRIRQPSKGIGPIDARLRSGGPGHYLAEAVTLSPGGSWQIEVTDRVSEFDQYSTQTTVHIR
ncbi:MAG: copper transport protein [Solirubrobacteraceae bacterium]